MAQETHGGSGPVTQRRSLGGARREATERVVLDVGDRVVSGWALNVSRGGMRVVIDETVEVASEVFVRMGEEARRRARGGWVRDEAGGQILGLEFLHAPSEPPGS